MTPENSLNTVYISIELLASIFKPIKIYKNTAIKINLKLLF